MILCLITTLKVNVYQRKSDLLRITAKLFYSGGLYFRVNSREHIDAKIKSSPIICNGRIIEEYMTSRENKVT